jgi:hypothetical protein
MKCAYHPSKDAIAKCSHCHTPLCDECAPSGKDKDVACSRCAALISAQDASAATNERFKEKEVRRQEQEAIKKRKSKILVLYELLIIGVCIAIIATQLPRLISTFEEQKPIRHGTYSTDNQTDQCIKNLWHISKLLQEGKLPGNDIVCPASKKPYVVTETEENVVVSSPSPELYGFKEIRVSKNKPVPELIK